MTFYQKVKAALGFHMPTTFANLADEMEADADAVRRELIKMKKRGKATADRNHLVEAQLWRLADNQQRDRL